MSFSPSSNRRPLTRKAQWQPMSAHLSPRIPTDTSTKEVLTDRQPYRRLFAAARAARCVTCSRILRDTLPTLSDRSARSLPRPQGQYLTLFVDQEPPPSYRPWVAVGGSMQRSTRSASLLSAPRHRPWQCPHANVTTFPHGCLRF